MNYSSKMKMRCIPILKKHYEQYGTVPELMALGFAAYIFFMKPVNRKGEQFFGEYKGVPYLIQDDQAEAFFRRWTGLSTVALTTDVLRDTNLWGEDLTALPGFQQAVVEKLNFIIEHGMKETLEMVESKKVFAA